MRIWNFGCSSFGCSALHTQCPMSNLHFSMFNFQSQLAMLRPSMLYCRRVNFLATPGATHDVILVMSDRAPIAITATTIWDSSMPSTATLTPQPNDAGGWRLLFQIARAVSVKKNFVFDFELWFLECRKNNCALREKEKCCFSHFENWLLRFGKACALASHMIWIWAFSFWKKKTEIFFKVNFLHDEKIFFDEIFF